MGQDLRIEDPDEIFFITSRTMNSRLWFVNNEQLHHYICAFLAKYQEKYGVIVYGFIIMGNHYHLVARFPRANMAAFMQSFNAIIARLVTTLVPQFNGGKLWGKRYSAKPLPRTEDVQYRWLYAALNPVSTGLTRFPAQYKTYNSFEDSIRGIERSFRIFASAEFQEAERRGHDPQKEAYFRTYTLKYSRIPGYDDCSDEEYEQKIRAAWEIQRVNYITNHEEAGGKYPRPEAVNAARRGAYPKTTKISTWDSFRALVLTLCSKTREKCTAAYFQTLGLYREASRRFREGDFAVEFPPGTYRPRATLPVPLPAPN